MVLRPHHGPLSPETSEQVGGYLKVLAEKYRMIERCNPIFAPTRPRRGRYYLRANFLTEIDLVAADEEDRRLRFATCKREAGKLVADVPRLSAHVKRFLEAQRPYRDWAVELVAIAPHIDELTRRELASAGVAPQDLDGLTTDL